MIKSEERCVLHPYLDEAGVPTIGYGTTVYPNGQHVTMKDADITQAMADGFLYAFAANVADAVTAMAPDTLNQNQFDSLVDFAYNVGTGALHGSTLLKLIKVNAIDPGVRTAFAVWDKIHVDGSLIISKTLVGRRQRDVNLYFKPI